MPPPHSIPLSSVTGTHTHTPKHQIQQRWMCVSRSAGAGWKSTPCHIYLHKSRRCMCVCLYTYRLCAWSLRRVCLFLWVCVCTSSFTSTEEKIALSFGIYILKKKARRHRFSWFLNMMHNHKYCSVYRGFEISNSVNRTSQYIGNLQNPFPFFFHFHTKMYLLMHRFQIVYSLFAMSCSKAFRHRNNNRDLSLKSSHPLVDNDGLSRERREKHGCGIIKRD